MMNSRKDSSPRLSSSGGEDVFDFPGVEDESNGSGPPSREAHAALREAFRSLKEYYLEAKAKNTELKAKLKQRDRRGSHSQVHQERDELQSLLQKSYLAYKEMYEQNEQLEMKRLKLAEELRQSQEVLAQRNGGNPPVSTSEEEGTFEQKVYKTIIEEFKAMGLEVIEENEQQFTMITDRDKLKKWIEERSDGNIAVVYKGCSLTDKGTQIEETEPLNKDFENERGKLRAEIIFLKRKVQDQANELGRFYKAFKDAMEQNLQYRKQIQGADSENVEKGAHAVAQQTRTTTSKSLRRQSESMLIFVKRRVTEMTQLKEHLDSHNQSLRVLTELSDRTTTDFVRLVSSRKPEHVPDSPQRRKFRFEGAEGGSKPLAQGQRKSDGNFDRIDSDDAPLSMPVQESDMRRILNTEANAEFSSEPMNNRRPTARDRTKITEGSAGAGVSDSARTGESDVEVIEEEEELLGATSAAPGKWCPVCGCFFPASYDQNQFELHVQGHFDDDS